ncbi:hypothetical protein JRF84_07350 [Methylobacterium organophilum]|jgi:hypothetical protein|nr:hypothetical protein [Methylobacterium organophilum]OXE38936.1 hypothetical protein CCS92_26830 [Methylobacterium radiotolerans]GAN48202.1 methyl-accepting chemotaxis sensory transducer [Methylobacterium sp. ME121]
MVWTATELRDGAGQIGSVFTAAVATKRRMTEDEIRQHRRSSGYIGAQTRQILPSRGKIGDDTRADALRRIMPSHYIEGGLKPAAAGVTALAAQTTRATAEISVQTARGQGVTAGAVGAVGVIAGRIREVIGAAVEERAAATQEIVRDVPRAKTGTDEVTRNVAGTAAASEEMGAAQVLDAANGLSRPSEHLVRRWLASSRPSGRPETCSNSDADRRAPAARVPPVRVRGRLGRRSVHRQRRSA